MYQRYVCVQLGMYASPRYVTIPTPPTHTNPKVCVCVCAYSWECMQVEGMLPIPTPPLCKSKVCYHPHPTQRYVCVCTVGNVCKSKVCYHPIPTHPPQPKGMCVCAYSWECMQVEGMLPIPTPPVCKSKVCYHPHPTQRYVCVYIWECMQVQGMLPSHPTQRYVCVCVYSWECMQVQGMLRSPPQPKGMCVCVRTVRNLCKSKVCYPSPPHLYASPRYVTIPTQPKGMCVCTVGNVCKSKVCYHPHPTHPPQPKGVCVCVKTPRNRVKWFLT